jgi:protein-disulfide isomerase
MHRRLLVSVFRGSLIALLLLCLGCSAQSNSPKDLQSRIERQIRATYASIPDQMKISLGDRKPSEFPDYDLLTIRFSYGDKKEEQQFLISKDNKTLVRFSKMDLTKDPYEAVMSKIDVANRPWRGNKDAKVVIVSYDDFQCPYCSYMHQTLFQQVFREYSNRVKIVYKDFPLTEIHPWAMRAAVDANCLSAQNNEAYWGFADYLHANGRQISGESKPVAQQLEMVDSQAREYGKKFNLDGGKLNACLAAQDKSAVQASMKEAEGIGVEATPTVFINGFKKDGALRPLELRDAIDRALRETGDLTTAPAASVPASAPAAR